MEEGKTTIQVSKETKSFLSNLGRKGETYDEIIRKYLRTVYDWDNVYRASVPLKTLNGGIYVDMILPKGVSALNIDAEVLADGIRAICEDNDIPILNDDEVPFFNDHFK